MLGFRECTYICRPARVAELVDALDSKSSGSNVVGVRVPPRAQKISTMLRFFFAFRLIPLFYGQTRVIVTNPLWALAPV
jgi:hypothetical protein